MKKILVVLTNTETYGQDPEKTGLWLAEATEFVDAVEAAGYTVDYVSPKGGHVPIDPRSLKRSYMDASAKRMLNDPDFKNRALTHSLAPENVNASDYVAIYYTGGHGVVWDFPDNVQLQDLTQSIFDAGGYVCSVCHGLAGLLNIRDEKGSYPIANKRITGFTREEELLSGKRNKVPFITETEARARGARFTKRLPFTRYATQDGRLITGQNPISGAAVAELLIQNLKD